MRQKKFLSLILALLTSATLLAQVKEEKPTPSVFEKKFRWGVSSNTYFSTLKGSSPAANYFTKPSLGFLLSAEYFPKTWIGVQVGAGFQQRGAGIRHQDKSPVVGLNPDSVYNERLRFNTIEIPLAVILRTPHDLVRGVRLSASAGIVPMFNVKSNDVFNSYEAGIRQIDRAANVSSAYFKNDLGWQVTLGPEIDSGGSGIFKIQFVYTQGTANVYRDNSGTAHNQTIGFRLSFLF